jgi:uncharacterized membrane protein YqjE
MTDIELGELDIVDKNNASNTTVYDDVTESQHLSSTDDLLRVEAKGCMGCLERIPLAVKLMVMISVSLFGFAFFGLTVLTTNSLDVIHAKAAKNGVTLMKALDQYVTALQYERIFSNAYIVFDTNAAGWSRAVVYQQQVDEIRDNLYKNEFPRFKKKYGVNFTQVLEPLQIIESQVTVTREKAYNLSVPVEDNYSYYMDYIASVINIQSRMQRLANLGSRGANYLLYTRYIEVEEGIRNYGGLVHSIQTISLDTVAGLSGLSDSKRELLNAWSQTTDDETLQLFNDTVKPPDTLAYTSNIVLDTTRTQFPALFPLDMDPLQFVNISSQYIESLRVIRKKLVNDMNEEQSDAFKQAVITIAVFTIFLALFGVLTILFAIGTVSIILDEYRKLY